MKKIKGNMVWCDFVEQRWGAAKNRQILIPPTEGFVHFTDSVYPFVDEKQRVIEGADKSREKCGMFVSYNKQ